MMWRFYKHNGQWAIWSAVLDDWVVTGLSEEELIDYYAKEKEKRARGQAQTYVHAIKQGKDPYFGAMPDEDELEDLGKLEELQQVHGD